MSKTVPFRVGDVVRYYDKVGIVFAVAPNEVHLNFDGRLDCAHGRYHSKDVNPVEWWVSLRFTAVRAIGFLTVSRGPLLARLAWLLVGLAAGAAAWGTWL